MKVLACATLLLALAAAPSALAQSPAVAEGDPAATGAVQMSPIPEEGLQLAQRSGRDFCITCWQEQPEDGKYTCWNVNAPILLLARLRGDLICAANFINPYYLYQRGKCETKNYCKTIKE